MQFSEKRSEIPILGLDSLLRQAYNPLPLPREWGTELARKLDVEWAAKLKLLKRILGLDSLVLQAYNPPPLPRMRDGN